MKKIKIVIACGSGVATSTLAANEVQSVCKEYGIDAGVDTCSMKALDQAAENADVILTTNKCEKDLGKPLMSVTPFITGIGIDKTRKKLGELLLETANKS